MLLSLKQSNSSLSLCRDACLSHQGNLTTLANEEKAPGEEHLLLSFLLWWVIQDRLEIQVCLPALSRTYQFFHPLFFPVGYPTSSVLFHEVQSLLHVGAIEEATSLQ